MKIIIVLFVAISIYFTIVAADCNQENIFSSNLYSYVRPNYTITFDDQGWSTEIPTTLSTPLTLSPGPITIRISCTNCQIQNSIFVMDNLGTFWNGSALWDSELTKPGYYMVAKAADSVLTFEFDPPVSQLRIKAMCGWSVLGNLKIYDANNIETGCSIVGNVQGENIYLGYTWTGLSKQIAKLEYTGGLFAIDEIDLLSGCQEGEYWNMTKCSDYDECNFGECTANVTNCKSTPNNTAQCSCIPGYIGDGIGPYGCDYTPYCSEDLNSCPNSTYCYILRSGETLCYCDESRFEYGYGSADNVTCVDINECTLPDLYPCVEIANCTNLYGGFQCTCPVGYEGDGIYFGTGCSPINLCSAPNACSAYASCESYNGVTLNCTCQEGYEGNGVGVNGCSPVSVPSSPVSSVPSTPITSSTPETTSAPSNNNTTAPIKKVSEASAKNEVWMMMMFIGLYLA